jgi:hypothetical protein
MYAVLVSEKAGRENFRFRLDGPTKQKWDVTCAGRRMKQQQMIEALVGWFLASEENQETVLRFDRENQPRIRKKRPSATTEKGRVIINE